MNNKKVLGLVGLASLGLAIAPLTVANAADIADTFDSQATVTFEENKGRKDVLDPTDTKNKVTPLNPDGTGLERNTRPII